MVVDKKITIIKKTQVCDDCGDDDDVIECFICEKDICRKCGEDIMLIGPFSAIYCKTCAIEIKKLLIQLKDDFEKMHNLELELKNLKTDLRKKIETHTNSISNSFTKKEELEELEESDE